MLAPCDHFATLELRGLIERRLSARDAVLAHPGLIHGINREYADSGADAVIAGTYYDSLAFSTSGPAANTTAELNGRALAEARRLADERAMPCGLPLIGTWEYVHDEPATHDLAFKHFTRQAQWAAEHGADYLFLQAFGYLGEASLALRAAMDADIPAVVTLNCHRETTAEGIPFVRACSLLAAQGAAAVGLCSSRGPDTMLPLLRDIREAVSCHVAGLVAPYATTPEAPTIYDLRRHTGRGPGLRNLHSFRLSDRTLGGFARSAAELGINYLGVSCGPTSKDIYAMARELAELLCTDTPEYEQSLADKAAAALDFMTTASHRLM